MNSSIHLPYEIKYNRYYSLIPVPFIIGLLWVIIYFIFIKGEDAEGKRFGIDFYVVFTFLTGVGLFLIYQFVKQFLNPRFLFRMDEHGMEYNGGGVGTGPLAWKDIYEVKEIDILTTQMNRPASETVLGVVLKDPDQYRTKKNFLLSKLMKVSDTMYDTSILISPSTFGKDYPQVKNKMQEMVALTNHRGPGYVSAVSE